jgi:tripartite-type tricarboxylate transporter receptor subunit TctC
MLRSDRRAVLASAVAFLCGAAGAQVRSDSTRILCGYPAGGSVDLVSRKAGEKLAAATGLPAFVDNRTGAAGRIAVTELLKGAQDGRTLLVTPASVLTMYPHVYTGLAYDPLQDLAPVCTVATTAFVLAAGPQVPANVRDLPAFVTWCRANPAGAQCGNAGAGSMPHFMAVLLARETGVPFDHVPFRGGSAAMQAVAAGDLAVALGTESSARSLVDAGRLRALSVTSKERSPFFPTAPPFQELGSPALTRQEWFGVFARSRTPEGTIERIADALRGGFDQPDARELLQKNALLPDHLGPAALAAALHAEHAFWGPLIRSSGFKPES